MGSKLSGKTSWDEAEREYNEHIREVQEMLDQDPAWTGWDAEDYEAFMEAMEKDD